MAKAKSQLSVFLSKVAKYRSWYFSRDFSRDLAVVL